MKKKNKFEKFGCEFKNEAECDEDLEEADSSLDEAVEEFFEEDEE